MIKGDCIILMEYVTQECLETLHVYFIYCRFCPLHLILMVFLFVWRYAPDIYTVSNSNLHLCLGR